MAGLTSLSRKKNIKGQPHKLAYITEAEGDLLKSMGGAGKPVKGTKGVPAYFDAGEGMDGYGGADSASGSGGASDTAAGGSDMDVDATYDGQTDFDVSFGMNTALGSAFGGGNDADKQGTRTEDFDKYSPTVLQGLMEKEAWGLVEDEWGNKQYDMDLLGNQITTFGIPTPQTVTNTWNMPISTSWGWLEQALDFDKDYYSDKKLRIPYDQQIQIDKAGFRQALLSEEERASLSMMEDPYRMNYDTNPEMARQYDEEIKKAAGNMSISDVLGVPQQDGSRIGGFINDLEKGGFYNTHGLGIRGVNETETPRGMTEQQHRNYEDIHMAWDGTLGSRLRMALDEVPSGTRREASDLTVQDIFSAQGVDPMTYGLEPRMSASIVKDYMDYTAIEGLMKGIPMAMSMVSPLGVFPDIFGQELKQEIGLAVDKITGVVKDYTKGTIFEGLVTNTEDLKDDLTNLYETEVPTEKNVVDRIANFFNIPTEYPTFYKKSPTNYTNIDSLLTDKAIAARDLETDVRDIGLETDVRDIGLETDVRNPDNMLVDMAGRIQQRTPEYARQPFTEREAVENYLALQPQDRMVNREPPPPSTLTSAPGADTTGMLYDPNQPIPDSVARAVETQSLPPLPGVDPVLQRGVSRVPRGSDTLPRLVQQGQPETYEAARRAAAERDAQQIDEDLAGYQSPFQPARPGDVQPETIQLGRDALGLSTEEEVVRDLTRDVIPDRDVVSSALDALTASDRVAERPTTEALSQLPRNQINATNKNKLENYVVDNVKNGFMTQEEGSAILAARNVEELQRAVNTFMNRQKRIQNMRERDLVN